MLARSHMRVFCEWENARLPITSGHSSQKSQKTSWNQLHSFLSSKNMSNGHLNQRKVNEYPIKKRRSSPRRPPLTEERWLIEYRLTSPRSGHADPCWPSTKLLEKAQHWWWHGVRAYGWTAGPRVLKKNFQWIDFPAEFLESQWCDVLAPYCSSSWLVDLTVTFYLQSKMSRWRKNSVSNILVRVQTSQHMNKLSTSVTHLGALQPVSIEPNGEQPRGHVHLPMLQRRRWNLHGCRSIKIEHHNKRFLR